MDRLDDIAMFVAVAEAGSFVAAARQAGRSPTAASRAVAALEDRLGMRLLTRTTRAVVLTEAGLRHLDACRRIVAEYRALQGASGAAGQAPAGRLTLTAPEMFGRLHLLPIAQRFMRAHPAIEISLLLLNRLVSLVDEGVDLGVRIAELPDSSLRAIRVGVVRRVLCASPAYLAARGIPAAPAELAAHDTIALADTVPERLHWRLGGGWRIAVTPRLIVNSVQAALDAAIAGGGIVHVLSYQSAAAEAAGQLQRILPEHATPPIPIQLVHPAGRHVSPKVRLFIDAAVAELRPRFG